MSNEIWLKIMKFRDKAKNWLGNRIPLICVVVGLLLVAIYGCMFYKVFGIYCPCCGVTRAWLCFLRGDVIGAFRYHGLFPVLPLIAVFYIWNDRVPRKLAPVVNMMLIVGGIAVTIYGFLRWCGLVAMP